MVRFIVKGTRFPDEFCVDAAGEETLETTPLDIRRPVPLTPEEMKAMHERKEPVKPPGQVAAEYQRAINDATALLAVQGQGVAPLIAHIQNRRHYLKLMLLSARELLDEVQASRGAFLDGNKKNSVSGKQARQQDGSLTRYGAFIDGSHERLKQAAVPVTLEEMSDLIVELRERTVFLFPEWCRSAVSEVAEEDSEDEKRERVTLSAKELEEVVAALYAQHENPDLNEDERLVVYHCRLMLDDTWREADMEALSEVGLWFAGKLMAGKVSKYGNAKSKLTVRVAKSTGPAPSGEPRMRYEDQRAMFQRLREKRATFQQLEESELRDRVVQQSRGVVSLGTTRDGSGTRASIGLDPTTVRRQGVQRPTATDVNPAQVE